MYSEKEVLNRKVSDPTGNLPVSLLSRKMPGHTIVRILSGPSNTFPVPVTYQVKPDSWSQHSYKGSEELSIATIWISPTGSGVGKKIKTNQP